MTNSNTDFIRSAMPLCALLGIEATEASAAGVVLTMEWRPELCTSGGLVHGGAMMALADAAGGACAYFNLPETATATPLHIGGMTIVIETELRHDERLVAKVTQTQAVLRPRAG